MKNYYNGKCVLVTGAGGALGSLMSDHLLHAGAVVLAVDIHEGALTGRMEENLHFFKCDLSEARQIAALAQDIKKKKFSVDILVNNAGVVNGSYLHETSPEAIQKALAINLTAPILLVRHFENDLEKNCGHLINISSAAGVVGVSRLTDYCAAKFGLFGFDEAIRVEWKKLKKKISTTVICPFYLQTEMFRGVRTSFPLLLPIMAPEKVVAKILKSAAQKKKRETFLFMVWGVWFLRLLPVSLFDAISTFFGINKSMDEFTGRHGGKRGVILSKEAVKEAGAKLHKPQPAALKDGELAQKKSVKKAVKKAVKKSVKK